ncbi:alpha/beta fold hydrolase [Sphingomonas bisphenolicum]
MAYLDADGGRLYYEHHRQGPVTVLLVHGWGTSTRIWDGVSAALLDAGHSVVSFDQRGCGQSDKDFPSVTIEAGGRDIVRLAEHLNLSQVILCGWSIGGALAMAAVPGMKDRCIGVISTCGATPAFAAKDDFPGAPAGAAAGMVSQLRADRFNFLAWMADNSVAIDVGAPALEAMRISFFQAAHSADSALLDLDTLDQRDILSALAVPFLAISGSKDILVDPAIQQAAADLAPHGEIEIFANSGHCPLIEEPARYRERLLRFIDLAAAN